LVKLDKMAEFGRLYKMNSIEQPYILAETEDFAVVFKPPRMHSAPLQKGEGNTLLDWYAALFPAVMDISGRKKGEGGLLHRLDFETNGLALFAKNQKSLDCVLTQQKTGNFIKEYSAICQKGGVSLPSFPPPPFDVSSVQLGIAQTGLAIESFFRPFGPGRKQVRPVTDASYKPALIAKDHGGCYRTEIMNIENNVAENEYYTFTIRLKRGFRHQIRCHLAWIGYPVLNDPLYGEQPANGFLALRSHGLVFTDPENGQQREYRIEPLSQR